MTPDKIKRLHRICGIATAVLIGITAIGLIVSCLSIYGSGERPFTAEIVAKALKNLAIPGMLCLIGVIFGIILQLIFPLEKEKTKAIRDKKAQKPKGLSPARLNWVRGGCIAAALLLIVLGIVNKGYADVLGKAIRICQECIGIG